MMLKELCKSHGIPSGKLNYENYREIPETASVLEAAGCLDSLTESGAVIYGGTLALPEVFGTRSMRKPSGDLDARVGENVVGTIAESTDERILDLFYEPNYDSLFLDISGIPVSLTTQKIHDWEIPEDFVKSAQRVSTEQGEFNCSSREYTITLKLRRAYHKGRMFGKDRVDIANMLLAPNYRELKPVNLEKLAGLMSMHVTSDSDEAIGLVVEISKQASQLRKNERSVFEKVMRDYREVISREY